MVSSVTFHSRGREARGAASGWVVPHDQLLAKVWGYEYRDENQYLRLYINYLRQKLERDPADPQYILTERGVGYRFVDYRRKTAPTPRS